MKPISTILIAAAVWCTTASGANADVTIGQDTPKYAQRNITLSPGMLRIDVGPPDFALMNSGQVGTGRGFVVEKRGAGADAIVKLASGASIGIIENLEAGAIVFPLIFSPDFDFGDLELYGRYTFYDSGDLQIAAQSAMLIPTSGFYDFGLSFGAAALMRLSPDVRLDAGAELEIVWLPGFSDGFSGTTVGGGTNLNVDLPVAINVNLSDDIFIGGRSGLFIPDFDYLGIALGFQGGYVLSAGKVDLTAWFLWPSLLALGADEAGNASNWQIGFGGNIYLNVF